MIEWLTTQGFDSIIALIIAKNLITITYLWIVVKLVAKYFIPGKKDDKFLEELEEQIKGEDNETK